MADPLDKARVPLRSGGYCIVCDRMVERSDDGGCPQGHPAEAVSGDVRLYDREAVPQLPRFNWAAFALPMVWGPAHGQWVGAAFLPIWVFVDNAVVSAQAGGPAGVGAIVIVAATLAFQAFHAKRANGLAWRRVCDRVSIERFAVIQRRWAYVCVPVGVAAIAWATYYRLARG